MIDLASHSRRRASALGAGLAFVLALSLFAASASAAPTGTQTADQANVGRAGDLDRMFNAPRGVRVAGVGGLFGSPGASGVALGRDGDVIVSGDAEPRGTTGLGALLGLRENGRIDRGFGRNGRVLFGQQGKSFAWDAVATQRNGRILVAGPNLANGVSDLVLARYGQDGLLDRSFGFPHGYVELPIGSEVVERAEGLVLQPDGRILVAGQVANGTRNAIFVARLDRFGNLDRTFGGGDGFFLTTAGSQSAFANDVTLQRDGFIVVTGGLQSAFFDVPSTLVVARLTPDGALDSSFGAGAGFVTLPVGNESEGNAISVQRDGRIVVGGSGNANDQDGWLVARFLRSGALDPSFGAGAGFVALPLDQGEGAFGAVADVALTRAGRIVLGGQLGPTFPGATQIYVARLRRNGSLDPSFARPDGFTSLSIGQSSDTARIALTDDEDIVVGGDTEFAGVVTAFVVAKFLGSNRRRG